MLNQIHPDFYGIGTSAMDSGGSLLIGRPYGGVAVLWNKKLANCVQIQQYNDPRILGIQCSNVNGANMLLLNVYLPYQCDDNFVEFCTYLAKINSILDSADTVYTMALGDFNADPRTSFGRELANVALDSGYVLSDMTRLNNSNDVTVFTYISDAHGTTSWLDHCLSSVNLDKLISSCEVSDKYVTSDHLPLLLSVNWDSAVLLHVSPPSMHKRYNWDNVTGDTKAKYEAATAVHLQSVRIAEACHCIDPGCSDPEHLQQTEAMYSSIINALKAASDDTLVSKATGQGKTHIIGWNDIVKDAHESSREAFLFWRSNNKPRDGPLYETMRRARAQFKYALRSCRNAEETLKADALAKSILDKHPKEFWKGVKKTQSVSNVLASTVCGVTGEADIASMWMSHFQSLFNSVTGDNHEAFVKDNLSTCSWDARDSVTPDNVIDALRTLSLGKSSGHDGLFAENFKFAHRSLAVLLALCLTSMLVHGYLPKDCMVTTLMPILKSKSGDISDKNNYRPIALGTVCSKILERVLLVRIEDYLYTADNQFGFKKKHGTDTCIAALKEIVNYYKRLSSPLFICFLDASKAFDRVNHWVLFKKLINRKVPSLIVRLLLFWYRNQVMNIRWGSSLSDHFAVLNGVRQGGILSPLLFNVYMDDLTHRLNRSGIGCRLGGVSLNNFGYADDMSIVAPSPGGLQKLIRICEQYAIEHDIIYNVKKSVCMLVKSKKVQFLKNPTIMLCGAEMTYVDSYSYLGCILSCDWMDDLDIARQRRASIIRANSLMRKFFKCTDDVKTLLFNTYCSNMYGSHLWTAYKKDSLYKLKVTYNNSLRKLFGLSWDCRASVMYVDRGLTGFDALRRKYLSGFMKRLGQTDNSLVKFFTGTVSWHTPGSLGQHIHKELYTMYM